MKRLSKNVLLVILLLWQYQVYADDVRKENKLFLYSQYGNFILLDKNKWELLKYGNLYEVGVSRITKIKASRKTEQLYIIDSKGNLSVLDKNLKLVIQKEVVADIPFDLVDLYVTESGNKIFVSYYDLEKDSSIVDIYTINNKSIDLLHSLNCSAGEEYSQIIDDKSFVCAKTPISDGLLVYNILNMKLDKEIDFVRMHESYKSYTWINPVSSERGKIAFVGERNTKEKDKYLSVLDFKSNRVLYSLKAPLSKIFFIDEGKHILFQEYILESLGEGLNNLKYTNKWFISNIGKIDISNKLQLNAKSFIGEVRGELYFLTDKGVSTIRLSDWPNVETIGFSEFDKGDFIVDEKGKTIPLPVVQYGLILD